MRDYSKAIQVFPAPTFLYLDILPLVEDETKLPDLSTATGPVPFRSNHPDLGEGKWKDLYEVSYILREGGFSLKKGESFMFRQSVSQFYAKLGAENLKRLEFLFKAAEPDLSLQFRFDLVEVTSDRRLEPGEFEEGGFEIQKKISGSVLPGQIGSFQLGESQAVEMELQSDGAKSMIEGRVSFGEAKEPKLQTGFFCLPGVPLILRQSWNGERWSGLVLRVVDDVPKD